MEQVRNAYAIALDSAPLIAWDYAISAFLNTTAYPKTVCPYAVWQVLFYVLWHVGYAEIGSAERRGARHRRHDDDDDDSGFTSWKGVVTWFQWAWYRGVVYPVHGLIMTSAARLLGNPGYRWYPAASLLQIVTLVELVAMIFPSSRYAAKRRLRWCCRKYERFAMWLTDDPAWDADDDDDEQDWDTDDDGSMSSTGGRENDRMENERRHRQRRQRFPHRSIKPYTGDPRRKPHYDPPQRPRTKQSPLRLTTTTAVTTTTAPTLNPAKHPLLLPPPTPPQLGRRTAALTSRGQGEIRTANSLHVVMRAADMSERGSSIVGMYNEGVDRTRQTGITGRRSGVTESPFSRLDPTRPVRLAEESRQTGYRVKERNAPLNPPRWSESVTGNPFAKCIKDAADEEEREERAEMKQREESAEMKQREERAEMKQREEREKQREDREKRQRQLETGLGDMATRILKGTFTDGGFGSTSGTVSAVRTGDRNVWAAGGSADRVDSDRGVGGTVVPTGENLVSMVTRVGTNLSTLPGRLMNGVRMPTIFDEYSSMLIRDAVSESEIGETCHPSYDEDEGRYKGFPNRRRSPSPPPSVVDSVASGIASVTSRVSSVASGIVNAASIVGSAASLISVGSVGVAGRGFGQLTGVNLGSSTTNNATTSEGQESREYDVGQEAEEDNELKEAGLPPFTRSAPNLKQTTSKCSWLDGPPLEFEDTAEQEQEESTKTNANEAGKKSSVQLCNRTDLTSYDPSCGDKFNFRQR